MASLKIGFMAVSFMLFSAAAQAQPAADKPKINVGDKWEFTQSGADGKTSSWSLEIVELPSADQIRARVGAGNLASFDSGMNLMPEGKPEYARLLGKYPLKVGDAWSFSRKFPNPAIAEDGKAKVVAFEAVTVPAGTFQCYRVEAEASLTNKSYKENRTWTRWYCPDVKWIAKEVLDTKISSRETGSSASVATSELVKFTAGK